MGSQWKREFVQDHKFDFINVDDFIDNSCYRQFRYMLMFAAIIRGILVYCSDIFTAANLLANSNENSFVPKSGVELDVFGKLPFEVYKWLFAGCILLGFLLLGLEIRRARAIILSRDISYAFTSQIASRFYSVRSYPHYCLFASIHNSKKQVDEVAFFCFFTFRNWKRLMLADAPRQVINATILYQTFRGHLHLGTDGILDWNKVVGQDLIMKKITLGGMIFTVFMFAFSLLMLLVAVILYIPLVTHIRGNLKEYCCHKIDKRIDELIRKKSRTRAADEAERNGGKDIGLANLQQPTLPQVDVLDPPVSNPRTPRTPYAKPSAPYHHPHPPPQTPQTPYSPYSYGQPTPKMPKQQPYPQQQQGYDYFQQKPKPPGSVIAGSVIATPKPKESVLDPYAESAFVTDDIYDHYMSDADQQQLQQSYPTQNTTHQRQDPNGYGYNGGGAAAYPHVNAPGNGPLGQYYKNGNKSNHSVRTPPRIATRYDGYGVPPAPASPIHSQHGSDLGSYHNGSHHSSQGGYGQGHNYGAGTGGGAGYGNERYGRGGDPGFTNEYRTPRRRDQSPAQSPGGYRGGGGY